MWFYLLICFILLFVYFGIILSGYFKNSEDFWQKEIVLLIIVGIGIFVAELVLYFGENYGLFVIGLVLNVFYLIMNVLVVRQKLYQ